MAKVGRPRKYNNCIDLDGAIELYFESRRIPVIDSKDSDGSIIEPDGTKTYYRQLPLTMSGLALAVEMDRDSVLRYSKQAEFYGPIKRAKTIVHHYVENYLFNGKNVAGAIFNLKNNFDWKDKQELDVDSKLSVEIVDYSKADETPKE